MSSEDEIVPKITTDDLFGSDGDESDIEPRNEQIPSLGQIVSREKGITVGKSSSLDQDLFGSDDDIEGEDDIASEREDRGKNRARSISRSRSGTPQSQREDSVTSDQQERVEIRSNIALPHLPVPKTLEGKFLLTRMPKFLQLESTPFDPDIYEETESAIEDDKKETIRSQVENTLRWRTIQNPDTGDIIKESNARLVKWADGSFSLLLNGEFFDAEINPVARNDYEYLVAHQTEAKVLESQLRFTHHLGFKPSTLTGDTHRILAATVAGRHKKEFRTKMYLTKEDPEVMKQKAEQAEAERLRAQRKLETVRRRYGHGLTEAALEVDDRSDEDNYGPGRRRNDQYEEDFVVSDDEEEEREREREQRIMKAKKVGMDKYKRKRDESEEESVEEASEEWPEEEEVIVKKPKRRQVFSEEDE